MSLVNFLSEVSTPIVLIILGASIVSCFFGYKMLDNFVPIYGFIVFAVIGALICTKFNLTQMTYIFVVVLSGIAGVYISKIFYKFSIFAIVSFGIYLTLIQILPEHLTMFASLISGILSQIFFKPIIVISTAAASSVIVATSILVLFPTLNDFSTIIFLAFAISGSIKQLK